MYGSDQVLSAEAERFERRLTDEIGALRAELHHEIGALRAELHQGVAALRLEMHDGFAAVRQELRQEIAAVRQDMASMRTDILKWSFLFWIGQVATITALFSFMLRSSGH